MMRSNKREAQNRQLQLMLAPARERLKKYTIEEICQNAGIGFDRSSSDFLIRTLNQTVRVRYPDFVIVEELDMWHTLTLLQYMDTADGTPLSDKMIGLTDMRGGLARGAGFDKDISTMCARYFSRTTAEDFSRACLRLGGVINESQADVTATLSYAPMFPVRVNFWTADDEFPASGKVLVNEYAEHYLTLEGAGGACSAVIQRLAEEIHR